MEEFIYLLCYTYLISIPVSPYIYIHCSLYLLCACLPVEGILFDFLCLILSPAACDTCVPCCCSLPFRCWYNIYLLPSYLHLTYSDTCSSEGSIYVLLLIIPFCIPFYHYLPSHVYPVFDDRYLFNLQFFYSTCMFDTLPFIFASHSDLIYLTLIPIPPFYYLPTYITLFLNFVVTCTFLYYWKILRYVMLMGRIGKEGRKENCYSVKFLTYLTIHSDDIPFDPFYYKHLHSFFYRLEGHLLLACVLLLWPGNGIILHSEDTSTTVFQKKNNSIGITYLRFHWFLFHIFDYSTFVWKWLCIHCWYHSYCCHYCSPTTCYYCWCYHCNLFIPRWFVLTPSTTVPVTTCSTPFPISRLLPSAYLHSYYLLCDFPTVTCHSTFFIWFCVYYPHLQFPFDSVLTATIYLFVVLEMEEGTLPDAIWFLYYVYLMCYY